MRCKQYADTHQCPDQNFQIIAMWFHWTIDWTSESSKDIRTWKVFVCWGETAAHCKQAQMPKTSLSFRSSVTRHYINSASIFFPQTYLLQMPHLTVFWIQLRCHWKNNQIQTSHLMRTLQEIRNNTYWKHSRLRAIQSMNQLRAAGETGCLPYFSPTKEVLILTITPTMFSNIFRKEVSFAEDWLLTL